VVPVAELVETREKCARLPLPPPVHRARKRETGALFIGTAKSGDNDRLPPPALTSLRTGATFNGT